MAISHRTEWWRIDSSEIEVADQWQDILSETHLPWSVAVPRQPSVRFGATLRRWWIDDLALVDCICTPCAGSRDRRELARTDGEFVVLLITRTGRETIKQGDAETVMGPGDAVVWDGTLPAQFTVGKTLSKRSLLIPYAALAEVGGKKRLSGGMQFNGATAAARVLTAYLDTLPAALPQLELSAVVALRNATLELLLGALNPCGNPPDSSTVRPALRAAMERHIEMHLMDYAVTPAAIAQAHGVSVRTVNRVFSATGQTVGGLVQMRRLARARDELINSAQKVSTIAHRWGFCDNSHFTRCFKAHYGSTPTEYRADRRAQNASGAPLQRLGAVVQDTRD